MDKSRSRYERHKKYLKKPNNSPGSNSPATNTYSKQDASPYSDQDLSPLETADSYRLNTSPDIILQQNSSEDAVDPPHPKMHFLNIPSLSDLSSGLQSQLDEGTRITLTRPDNYVGSSADNNSFERKQEIQVEAALHQPSTDTDDGSRSLPTTADSLDLDKLIPIIHSASYYLRSPHDCPLGRGNWMLDIEAKDGQRRQK